MDVSALNQSTLAHTPKDAQQAEEPCVQQACSAREVR